MGYGTMWYSGSMDEADFRDKGVRIEQGEGKKLNKPERDEGWMGRNIGCIVHLCLCPTLMEWR